MKITKHAQSCFYIETTYSNLLLDPGTYVFNEEKVNPIAFKETDLIIITHEHRDHFDWGNIQIIMEMSNCNVIGSSTACQIINEKYPSRATNISSGFKHKVVGGIEIEGFPSVHGPLPNGKTPPIVSGVVIDDGETSFYSPGDSINLNTNVAADIIATPICGQVVMDIRTAKEQLIIAKPKIAIPIHYNNPDYPVSVNDFVEAMKDIAIEVKVLDWGKSIEI
jgi:L-ascorbate metabolism protein UlaG (beta-lactamase superfamily)